MRFARSAGAREVVGVEVEDEKAARARERGIAITSSDLNRGIDVPDATVDVVTANQVIEHLYDTDGFMRDVHRVLRPGGTVVVSTNNLASWHNIVALVLGAQPFPADVSSNVSVGKLLGLFSSSSETYNPWSHLRIFSYRALLEMMRVHGFEVRQVEGVGYYPLPSRLANRVARWDPRHAAYLTVQAQKPAIV